MVKNTSVAKMECEIQKEIEKQKERQQTIAGSGGGIRSGIAARKVEFTASLGNTDRVIITSPTRCPDFQMDEGCIPSYKNITSLDGRLPSSILRYRSSNRQPLITWGSWG